MKRILFMAEAVTLAHVGRPLLLAQGLDPTRFEVHFAVAPWGRRWLGKGAMQVHELRTTRAPESFGNALAKGQPLFTLAALAAGFDEDRALLDAIRPDLVVGDFRLSLAASARVSGVPYANICNAYWSPWADPLLHPLPELPHVRILGPRLGKLIFDAVRPLAFRLHARPHEQLRRRHGVKPAGGLRACYTEADQVLYADPATLVPTRGAPPNHMHLGALNWAPDIALPDWWERLPRDAKLAYVTLGSSGHARALPAVLDALRALGVQALVATAGRAEVRHAPEEGLWVSDYLPGDAACARADFVVCNGGASTAYQALAAGKPVLGIASNMDQYLAMHFIEAAGAGVTLRAGQTTARSIEAALRKLLDAPAPRARAQALAPHLAPDIARTRFAQVLQRLT
jgi:UDP:flavonoid glycosyltransferase YjiC (YdhE family)